jgi:signal transduction histidine kinase
MEFLRHSVWGLLSIGACLLALSAKGQEIIIDRYEINRHLTNEWLTFQPQKKNTDLDYVRNLKADSWQSGELPKLGVRNSVWLKAQLVNHLASPQTLYFEIPTLNIEKVHYYLFASDQLEKQIKTGEAYPFRNRDVFIPRYSFRARLAPGETKTVYFQLVRAGVQNIFFMLKDQKTFEETLFVELVVKSMAFGVMGALAFAYFALGFYRRDKRFLLYSGWMVGLVLAYMRVESFTFVEFGRDIHWWNQWNMVFYCLVADFFLILFWREHPNLQQAGPYFRKLLMGLAFFVLSLAPLTAIYFQPWVTVIPVPLLLLLTSTALVIVTKSRHQQQTPLHFYYRASAIGLICMVLSHITLVFVGYRSSWLLRSILFQALIVELVIFLVALYSLFQHQDDASRLEDGADTLDNSSPQADDRRPHRPTQTVARQAGTSKPGQAMLQGSADMMFKNEQNSKIQAEKLASLGTLASGLAHELNNPLAIITGHHQRLLGMTRRQQLSPEKTESSLVKIGGAIKRIQSVVDALKVYSKDSSTQPRQSPINMRDTVQYTLDLCRERLFSLGISLTTQPIPDTLVEANQSQIMQVLLTLIDNAVDAVADQDEKTIGIDYRQTVTFCEIAVTDNGPGIPHDRQIKIFDPFYTGRKHRDHRGLGLSMAFGIAAQHDGKLYLDTTHPQTRFVLRLRR